MSAMIATYLIFSFFLFPFLFCKWKVIDIELQLFIQHMKSSFLKVWKCTYFIFPGSSRQGVGTVQASSNIAASLWVIDNMWIGCLLRRSPWQLDYRHTIIFIVWQKESVRRSKTRGRNNETREMNTRSSTGSHIKTTRTALNLDLCFGWKTKLISMYVA